MAKARGSAHLARLHLLLHRGRGARLPSLCCPALCIGPEPTSPRIRCGVGVPVHCFVLSPSPQHDGCRAPRNIRAPRGMRKRSAMRTYSRTYPGWPLPCLPPKASPPYSNFQPLSASVSLPCSKTGADCLCRARSALQRQRATLTPSWAAVPRLRADDKLYDLCGAARREATYCRPRAPPLELLHCDTERQRGCSPHGSVQYRRDFYEILR